MEYIAALQSLLATPQRVVITTHHKPDGDALGSSLAVAGWLEQLGHQVNVISPSDFPRFLEWMAGSKDVIIFNEGNEARSAQLIADATVIFCLDFSSMGRINEMGPLVLASAAVKVLIDHHLDPEDFAAIVKHDIKAAATAQLVFELIDEMGHSPLINRCIAECIYAGLLTDTGSFRFPSTTSLVHQIVARLIERGVDNGKIHKLIYDNNTESRLRFLGYILSQKMVVLPEFAAAYITITKEELDQFQAETGDTEGFVNYALSIKGIAFAAIIVDRTEAIKISFRSVGQFSVKDFACKHFDGGGHRNAAGGRTDTDLEEAVQRLLNLLPAYKDQLLASMPPDEPAC